MRALLRGSRGGGGARAVARRRLSRRRLAGASRRLAPEAAGGPEETGPRREACAGPRFLLRFGFAGSEDPRRPPPCQQPAVKRVSPMRTLIELYGFNRRRDRLVAVITSVT